MEPIITPFVISLAAGIVFDFIKNNLPININKDIDKAFNKALDKSVPSRDILTKKSYKYELKKIIRENYKQNPNADLKSESISGIHSKFFIEFEQALLVNEKTYLYIKENRDYLRFQELKGGQDEIRNEIITVQKRLDVLINTDKKINEFYKIEIKKIKELIPNENYYTRTFRETINQTEIPTIWEDSLTLNNIIKDENKIVILGNPGLGKTTELEHLSINILNENDKYLPIYRNFKTFTQINTIENYINFNLKELDDVIYIFDGIDEIQNIQDFISKLIEFIRVLDDNRIDYKIILSCRTNIFESYVKEIVNFKQLYLNDLPILSGVELLNKKIDTIINYEDINRTIEPFLKNPYLINILSEYINKNNELPNSTAELWNSYINKRLSEDDTGKLIKLNINPTIIKFISKKISLINELKKEMFFLEDELFNLLNNSSDFKEFLKNPLIEKVQEERKWFFEHKNIQEYFAAEAIKDKNTNEIIDFITVNNINKTHPSLYNTISFLINLLDEKSDKYNEIVNWFIENEPEILFNVDLDRLSINIREIVFQEYFKNVSIEKTYWINLNKTFEIDKIARFGNLENNYAFLFKVINNTNNHFRTRVSAINILYYFTLTNDKKDNLKQLIIEQLKDNNEYAIIKSTLIDLISYHDILKNDNELIDEIFNIFNNEHNKEINSSLLKLLLNIGDRAFNYEDYIKNEFLRANKIVKRNDNDEVIRGNTTFVIELVLKSETNNFFLDLISYFLNGSIDNYTTDDYSDKIFDRCLYFVKKESDFIINFLDKITHDRIVFNKRDFIFSMIVKSNNENKVLKYLLNIDYTNDRKYLLARLIDFSNIEYTIEKLIEKKLEDNEIEVLRNIIGNSNNRDVAEKFHIDMQKRGVKFQAEFITNKIIEKNKLLFNKQVQKNWNLLFNKEKLLNEIQKIFIKNGEILTKKEIIRLKPDQSFHITEQVESTPLQLIRNCAFKYNSPVKYSMIENYINDEYHIFSEVIRMYTQYKDTESKIKISVSQVNKIKQWCIITSEQVIIKDIIKIKHDNSFNYNQIDYRKIKLIILFIKEFNIKIDTSFLINFIEINDFDNYEIDSSKFNELKEIINDSVSFDNKIIENLNDYNNLILISLQRHINYALDNSLTQAYPIIKGIIKEKELSPEIIKKYIDKTNNLEFLKDIDTKPKSYIFWFSIELMMKYNVNKEYCINQAVSYLKSNNQKNIASAINVLLHYNHPLFIEYVIKYLRNGVYYSLRDKDTFKYSITIDDDVLKELYYLIYTKASKDYHFDTHSYREFLNGYIRNISSTDEGYKNINKVLLEIKENLITKEEDVFYINLLIDNAKDAYINFKSKPYTFSEALNKIQALNIM